MRAAINKFAATVRRFNGGQFAIDGDEGIVQVSMGRANMRVTNLGGYSKPRGPVPSEWAANVGVHPGAPQPGMKGGPAEGSAHQHPLVTMHTPYAGSVKGPKRVSDQPAHVGGGHPRGHQG